VTTIEVTQADIDAGVPQVRCLDLTRAPRGYLRCVKPLGHPERDLHQIDPAGPVISAETVRWVDKQLAGRHCGVTE
jgi:hypothetical protein